MDTRTRPTETNPAQFNAARLWTRVMALALARIGVAGAACGL